MSDKKYYAVEPVKIDGKMYRRNQELPAVGGIGRLVAIGHAREETVPGAPTPPKLDVRVTRHASQPDIKTEPQVASLELGELMEVLDFSIKELKKYVAGTDDINILHQIRKGELDGDERAGALDVIDARMAELSAD